MTSRVEPCVHTPDESPALDDPALIPAYRCFEGPTLLDMTTSSLGLRIGQAAELLAVGVDTLRRWEAEGRLKTERSQGGQRLIPIAEVNRLLAERRATGKLDRPIGAQSARNRFHGIVSRVEIDRVAAVVEVMAGPHRMVSLMTAEAAKELNLKAGDEVVCAVKATNVVVEVPS